MTDIEQALQYIDCSKAKPVCIDFVDGKIGIMVGMWKKRMRIYRQKGVNVDG